MATVEGMANSAVCVYDMNEIQDVFEMSEFKGQKPGEPDTVIWCPTTNDVNAACPGSAIPSPRPGTVS